MLRTRARNRALASALLLLLATPGLAAFEPGQGAQDSAERLQRDFQSVLKERAKVLDARETGIGELVPDLEFTDFEGRAGKLSDYAERPGHRGLVIVVRQIGCPVCERYSPRLARLEAEYGERGVDFLFLNMDRFVEAEEVREEELEPHGFTGRYVHDPEETFGKALGTETTTVCYLLDSARTLRYRGAVDDQYGRGVILPEPQHQFLRDALESVLAGQEVAVPATSAPGCALNIAREVAPLAPDEVTYHNEVARILQTNCVECHHDGGAAPFALDDFKTAFDKRRMLGLVVEERIMPPWYAADGTGPWKNDRRMTQREIDTLLAWIENGAPEGDPQESPVPLSWKAGWTIGEPDEVFAFPAPQKLDADGVVEWMHVEAEHAVPRDLWVSRIQVLPSNPQVVHHASAEFLPPPREESKHVSSQLMETLTPWTKRKPRKRPERWQYLFGYLPGKDPRTYEEGVASFLPKGARIRFGMHYTPNGRATEDRTSLGVVLADEESRFVAETIYMHAKNIDIPPDSTAEFGSEMTVPYDVLARSITPHMHLRGRTFTSEAIYPDGRRELLLSIPEWDQDWQNSYVFAEEKVLPKGTRITIHGTFDNTAANLNNPDPTQHVTFGQQIWDEMLTMAVEWIRPREQALRWAARSNPNAAH